MSFLQLSSVRLVLRLGLAISVISVSSEPAEAGINGSVDTKTTSLHVWIFSGQSNMQKIGRAAQAAVGAVVSERGHAYGTIYSAAPGKPIEAWLDPDHRDHSLWTNIEKKVAEAKKGGGKFEGFVWYQGESDVNEHAGQYEDQLTELIRRVRKLTGNEQLPVVIVQIGAATSYSGRDWACGTVREAQRRVAAKDDRVALVTAIDAQLHPLPPIPGASLLSWLPHLLPPGRCPMRT